jgi:thioredoxin-dependent peroxiredoxin
MKDRPSLLLLCLALAGLLWPLRSHAVLAVGARAPDFTATALLGGARIEFNLARALKKGPVVLYFYPKAFASQCTIEARAFAEAAARFKALGATVIGVSNDSVETLKLFSVTECRRKFAVAADVQAQVMRRYDAVRNPAAGVAERVSYVISPQGRVLHVHSDQEAGGHVDNALAALKKWKKAR